MSLTKEPQNEGLAGATKPTAEIIQHGFSLLRNGYREESIKARMRRLRHLAKLGANLFDPESVKEVVSKQKWAESTKRNHIDVYGTFAREHGPRFEKPRYRIVQKLPFIPTETELDQLIAGCGRKTSIVLQLLKETGMRCGEAYALEWRDLDYETHTIGVNAPEKGSNARSVRMSMKLEAMLKSLPQKNAKVFGNTTVSSLRVCFTVARKRLVHKLKNPRLLNIRLHTFRHWKATMEYHKTKDIRHVQQLLGHRSILSTQLYTQLINLESDEYHCKVAKIEKEKCELIEAGFEHVATEPDGAMYFRKRK